MSAINFPGKKTLEVAKAIAQHTNSDYKTHLELADEIVSDSAAFGREVELSFVVSDLSAVQSILSLVD